MALTTVKSDQIQTSVALAGSPTTTTQSASDNSTKVATTAYADTAVANLVASAPAALNTLDELAAALNDDASFSTTITNSIATKLPLAGGTLTGALHIETASAGTVTASTQADDLVIENSAEGGMTIITPDNQSARIRFTSPSTNTAVGGASIFYRQNINKMNVGTEVSGGILALHSGAGSETMRLDSTGNVGIGTGASPGSKLTVSGLASLVNLGGGSTGSAALYVNSTSGHTGEMLQILKNGSTRMEMTNSGYLGIGNSSPSAKLDVVANDNVWTGEFTQSNTSNGDGVIVTVGSTAAADYALSIRSDAGNTGAFNVKADGNVGIGTFSPTFTATSFKGLEVEVSGDLFPNVRLERVSGSSKTNQAYEMVIGTAGNWHVRNATQGTAPFSIATTDAITMSRLVGISATPETHYTGYAALDFGLTGTLYSATSGTNITSLLNNAYLNSNASAWVYKQADEASYLAMMDGEFRFFTAAAGSAGGSITWDEKMHLSQAGNLGIGTGNPQRRLHVSMAGADIAGNGYDGAIFQNSDAVGIRLVDQGNAGSNGGNAGLGNDNGNLNIASAGVMTFSTNLAANAALYGGASTGGTERMRIDGTNIGIGTQSPNSPLHVYGRLHHNATIGTSHTGASNTAHSITNTSIIGDKLRFSIQVYFQNGTSNLAIRIYVNVTSLWLAGEVCIGSTYSNASATGLNRYSFSHNYNTTTNYGYHLAQTENFGQVPSHFTFHSHGYDSTEGAHYFEFRHITSTGNTMYLQFEGNGSSPAHANLATWYYKHKTY